MDTLHQIQDHLASLKEPKRSEMGALHLLLLQVSPGCKLWFSDGKDDNGKIVSNPTIGYGTHTIEYADGTAKEYFRIGLSANKTGISVYILGIKDKAYLAETYGNGLGKASVSAYCIKFKTLKDVDIRVLEAAVRDGMGIKHEHRDFGY
jgi:Domain of unknown function (DU1801)